MNVTRPIVRYHGGKWKLAPWIISHFPPHRVYVEPFGGGASVLLRKRRSYAEVYNDLDGEIVNLFRVARDRGPELAQKLRFTPFAREEFAAAWKPTEDPVEWARRTVIRAFMGFGSNSIQRISGFRSNSNRSGTTPAGDWRNFPDAFERAIDRLQGVVIENREAMKCMAQHDSPKTLHYVDPPYVKSTRDRGKDYHHELSDEEHRELAEFLTHLEGMVIVSGYPSQLYHDVYDRREWTLVSKTAMADGARPRLEGLWMRNVPLGLFDGKEEAA